MSDNKKLQMELEFLFDAKGIKRARKETKKLKNEFISLAQLSGRIKNSLGGVFNQPKVKNQGLGQAILPTKGGFDKEQFIGIKKATKDMEMFGKKNADTFETIKRKNPFVEMKDNSKEIAQLETNFGMLQNKMRAANAKQIKQGAVRAKLETKDIERKQKLIALQNNLGKKLSATSRPFQGWAMSMMFAGMAMMRYMQLIWTSATKTFQEVSHSVEGTTTSFDVLNGQMKYMQFVAGEALAPLAEALTPIIAWLAVWISDNEEIFRGLVKWGFIVGTLFFAAGQLGLAIMGIVEAGEKLAIIGKAIGASWKKFSFKKWADDASNAVANMGNKISMAGKWLKDKLIKEMKWIRAHPIKAIVGGLVLTGIIMAFMWIVRLKNAMGGWGEFGKNVLRGLVKGVDYLINKKKQYHTYLKQVIRGVSSDVAWRIAEQDFIGNMQIAQRKMEESLGTPMNGYVQDTRTLAEIWAGDIYPEIEAAEEAMKNIGDTMKEIKFSSGDINSLWAKGFLNDSERIGALLSADTKNEATLSDDSEKLLMDLYEAQTGEKFFIDNLTIESNADSIESILDALKSKVNG